ncbi:MAG TPA: hypothetical protein VF821_18765, partial [Lentzea sp.]
SKAVPKPVTPMAQENPGPAPAIPAAGAAPKPAPPAQTDLSAGKQQVAQEQGDVTDEQLRQSNEPQFQQALDAKQAAAAHADTAPGQFRAQEQQVIGQAKADASAETAAGVAGMQGAKGAALAKLVADKGKTKTKDEAKRAEVTTKVQGIFTATEAEVKKILEGIDPKVDAAFTRGEAQARQAFEAFVAAKVGAYKQDRYSGWLGGFRWAKDKLMGMPDKVNEFYTAGRELYLKQMDGVISRVADIVGNDLSLAKQKIAAGKAEITAYVKTLSPDLQKVGAEASEEINSRFEQLESDVDEKQNAVVDSLASKYVEARQGLDERIEALQAENKGLVDAAIDAVKGVINTIRELAAMLRDVLSRAAGVVGDIIKKPVEFLGNLIAGVKGGILKFKDNILDHLRKGLMGWLFGALAEAGIELPEKFDIRGIVKLLASIFGLTWSNIRNRLVKQIGEKAMAAAEKGVEIFQVLTSQGVAGLWQMLLEKLGDIKNMILEQVKDFVITKIITAGITWLIGLLNPAAAFIKACKLIYDVVMFFVNNGSRILKFVNTVIDSVADIVRGNVSGVVNKINDVLGQMVPIIIGFLASAIGLGGIGAKIKSIIETLQKPVNKALDWVIKKGLTLAGPIIKAAKGVGAKVKAKVAAGKAWVKGKVDAGKQWAKDKWQKFRQKAPFTAQGKAHNVIVQSDRPGDVQILVASKPKTPAQAMNDAMAAADLDGPRLSAYRERVAVATNRERALRELARQTMMSAGPHMGVSANMLPEARALADAIAACWDLIGYDGESVGRTSHRRGEAGAAGDVHQHNKKGRQYDDDLKGQERQAARLESEHVIPWGWVQEIVGKLMQLGDLPGQKSSRAYKRMTTVMVYERAAELKTTQLNNNDAEFKNWIKGISPEEARLTLADHLPKLVESRVQIIVSATEVYVEKVKRDSNGQIILEKKPDRATIVRATAGQLAEIFAAVREARR